VEGVVVSVDFRFGVRGGGLEVLVLGIVVSSGLDSAGGGNNLLLVDSDDFFEESLFRLESLDTVIVLLGFVNEVLVGGNDHLSKSFKNSVALVKESNLSSLFVSELSELGGEFVVFSSEFSSFLLDFFFEVGGIRVTFDFVSFEFLKGLDGGSSDVINDLHEFSLDGREFLDGGGGKGVDSDLFLVVILISVSDLGLGELVDSVNVVHKFSEDIHVFSGIDVDEVSESFHNIGEVFNLEKVGVESLNSLGDNFENSKNFSVDSEIVDIGLGGFTSSVKGFSEFVGLLLHVGDVSSNVVFSLLDVFGKIEDNLGDSLAFKVLNVSKGGVFVEGSNELSLGLNPSSVFVDDIFLGVVNKSLEEVEDFLDNSFSLLGDERDEVVSHFFN